MADVESVLIDGVLVATGIKVSSIDKIVTPVIFNSFITKLYSNSLDFENLNDAQSQIQLILKEYFVNDDLIDYSKANTGDKKEITKLILLLLYAAFISDKDVRVLLSNNLSHAMQLRLKYYFECIQKRASGLGRTYLDVLVSENFEKGCGSSSNSVGSAREWLGGSPTLYTSSPKCSSANMSPLKELLQSPSFRIQKKLVTHVKDVKRLSKEIIDLENEKAELLSEKEVLAKKFAKQELELQKLREHQVALREDRDSLEALVHVGEDQIHSQAVKLGRELAHVRGENLTLQQTLKEVNDKNEELETKYQLLNGRLTKLQEEREKANSDLAEFQQQHQLIVGQLDERDHLLLQQNKRIQELEQLMQENCGRNSRLYNFTVETLDSSQIFSPGSTGFSNTDGNNQLVSPDSGSVCENLGDAVVDLMLQETRHQLQALQEQHSALQADMNTLQSHHEQAMNKCAKAESQYSDLKAKLRSEEREREQCHSQLNIITAKLQEQTQLNTKVTEQLTALQGCNEQTVRRISELEQQLREQSNELVESSLHAQGLASQLEDVMKQKANIERDFADSMATLRAEYSDTVDVLKQSTAQKVSELEEKLIEAKSEISRLNGLNANNVMLMEDLQRSHSEKEEALLLSRQRSNELQQEVNKMLQLVDDQKSHQQQLEAEYHQKVAAEREALLSSSSEKQKELQAQSEVLREELQKEKKNNIELNNTLRHTQTEFELKLDEVSAKLSHAEQKAADLHITLQSMQLENESNVTALQDKLSVRKHEIDSLSKKLQALREEVSSKQMVIENLNEQLSVVQSESEHDKNELIVKLNTESLAFREKEARILEKVTLLEASRMKYETELLNTERNIADLNKDSESRQEKIRELELKNTQLSQELTQIQNENKEKKQKLCELQLLYNKEVSTLQDKVKCTTEESSSEKHRLEKQVDLLQEKLHFTSTNAKHEKVNQDTKIAALQVELEACQLRNDQMSQKSMIQEQELKRAITDKKILEDKYNSQTTKYAELENLLQDAKKTCEQKDVQFSVLEKDSKQELDLLSTQLSQALANYQELIAKQQMDHEHLIDAKVIECNKQVESLLETVKVKESVILSLMDSVQVKDREIKAKIQELQKSRDSAAVIERQLEDMKMMHQKERDDLDDKFRANSDELCRVRNELSNSCIENEKNNKKCLELQRSAEKMKCEYAALSDSCKKQRDELDFAYKDLSEFKTGCTLLKQSIQSDKEEHSKELLALECLHKARLEEQMRTFNAQLLDLEMCHKLKMQEKEQSLTSLQNKHEELCMQSRSLNEDHDTKIAKLQHELTALKLKSAEFSKQHEENVELLRKKESDVHVLQKRIQEFITDQEALEHSASRSKKEYEAKLKELRESLEATEQEREHTKDSLIAVTKEKDEARDQIIKMNEEFDRVKKETNEHICSLQNLLSNAEISIQNLQIDNAAQAKQISEYENDIKVLGCSGRERVERLEKMISEQKDLSTTLAAQLSEQTLKMKSLSQAKEELEFTFQVERNHLRDECSRLQKELNSDVAKRIGLEHELDAAKTLSAAEIESLRASLSEVKSSVTSLEEEKLALELVLKEDASEKSKISVQLIGVTEEMKVLKHQLLEQREAAESTEQKCSDLDKQLQFARKQTTEAQSEANATIAEIQELKETVDSLMKENNKLTEQITSERNALHSTKAKLLSVEAQLIDREKEKSAAMEEVRRVEREAENDVASLKGEIAGLKHKFKEEKLSTLEKMKNVFKDQIAKLMAELERCEQKYEAAKHKLAQVYSELNDASKARDDYFEQMSTYKDHVSHLRNCLEEEKEQRNKFEHLSESLQEKLNEMSKQLKQLHSVKLSLEAQLATADSKIRELNRNWSRESLGGPDVAVMSFRNAVSDSTLSSGQPSVQRSTRSSSKAGLAIKCATPSQPRRRLGSSAYTASYRKAVGRTVSSSNRGPSSSSIEEDLLDGSDVPLLSNESAKRRSQSSGLFRKPSIRITSSESVSNSRPRDPVQLCVLTAHRDIDFAAAAAEELKPQLEHRAQEPERKKRHAVQRDRNGRRMTVDGRILPDDEASAPAKPTGTATSCSRVSLARSVPRGLSTFFNCEDEDQEFFSNKYLQDMKGGRCEVEDDADKRLSELQRRNSLYPPQLRCSYAAEMQYKPINVKIDPVTNMLIKEDGLQGLTKATERLAIESPAFNLRKRKSLSDSLASTDSLDISIGKKIRRLSTSYSRPGPPTPGRKSIGRIDKENRRMSLRSQGSPSVRSLSSTISSSSLSARRALRSPILATPSTRKSAGDNSSSGNNSGVSPESGVGSSETAPAMTPGAAAGRRRHPYATTPASIKRLIKGKSPWKKLTSEEATDNVTQTPRVNTKLKIFRKPFGSKNYNVLSASQRTREPKGHKDSLSSSTGPASRTRRSLSAACQ